MKQQLTEHRQQSEEFNRQTTEKSSQQAPEYQSLVKQLDDEKQAGIESQRHATEELQSLQKTKDDQIEKLNSQLIEASRPKSVGLSGRERQELLTFRKEDGQWRLTKKGLQDQVKSLTEQDSANQATISSQSVQLTEIQSSTCASLDQLKQEISSLQETHGKTLTDLGTLRQSLPLVEQLSNDRAATVGLRDAEIQRLRSEISGWSSQFDQYQEVLGFKDLELRRARETFDSQVEAIKERKQLLSAKKDDIQRIEEQLGLKGQELDDARSDVQAKVLNFRE